MVNPAYRMPRQSGSGRPYWSGLARHAQFNKTAAYDITDDTEKTATTKLFVRPGIRARPSLTASRKHVSHGSTTDEDREDRRLLSMNDVWSRMVEVGVGNTALARFELDFCFSDLPDFFLRIKRQGYKSHCFTLFTSRLITSLGE